MSGRPRKKKGAKSRRPPANQNGEGIGDWFRSAKRVANKTNNNLKKARIVGRTDDFLARTGFRDPVRNLIASSVPHGNQVIRAADYAKKKGYGSVTPKVTRGGAKRKPARPKARRKAQQGDGIIGDLLTGASSLIPGVGPVVAPLVGNLTSKIGLGQTYDTGARAGPKVLI